MDDCFGGDLLLSVDAFGVMGSTADESAEAILARRVDAWDRWIALGQAGRALADVNAPGREQTRKRRSVVPIAPTLAPWLRGLKGKVIRYQIPSPASRVARGADPVWEFEVYDIGKSFEKCLVLAGEAHPDLGLSRQATDKAGNLLWLPPR